MDVAGETSPAFESAFAAIKTAKDVAVAIEAIRDHYGLAHITYHHAQTVPGKMAVDAPFVRTTYPDAWVARYLMKGYVAVDPIVREGLLRTLPFDWSEVEIGSECADLFADFGAHGLGANGYSIPITDKAGRRALLSLNSHPAEKDWCARVREHQQDWIDLAHVVHRKAIFELYGDHDPIPLISPRELETLYWVGQGKEAKDIAVILAISEHTVRSYMRSVRFKLDCSSLTQAVAKAVTLRLIKG